MSKKVAILQSNYIPWKGYFDLIAKADVFVIYDEVQYTKNDWRNRNMIQTANGLQWMTIPVRQESLDQKIFESKIFADNWAKKHISTLQGNYSKAEHFKVYKDRVFNLYENQSNLISQVNVSFIKGICSLLGITTQIIDSRDLNLEGDRNIRLLEACKKLNATTYISGPAAKSYLDTELFSKENIEVEWMDYSEYKTYQQVFQPFQHGVSVLDLIFNTGDNAKRYMKYVKE
ncbi:MAG: WbqC family protein [Bacteroidota bacterium]